MAEAQYIDMNIKDKISKLTLDIEDLKSKQVANDLEIEDQRSILREISSSVKNVSADQLTDSFFDRTDDETREAERTIARLERANTSYAIVQNRLKQELDQVNQENHKLEREQAFQDLLKDAEAVNKKLFSYVAAMDSINKKLDTASRKYRGVDKIHDYPSFGNRHKKCQKISLGSDKRTLIMESL